MIRFLLVVVLGLSVSVVDAQLSELKAGMSEWMRLKVHTKDEIVVCTEIEGMSSFFEAGLIAVRSSENVFWPVLLAEHNCALLRPGDGVVVLGITPDGEADEDEIERAQFDLEEDTLDILRVEIVPNPNLNAEYFILDGGNAVRISGEGIMWVIVDYLEKYTSYWQ